jgi:hypothetical protein
MTRCICTACRSPALRALGGRVFRCMKAIPTAELCITCHGSNLDPAIAATLAEFYPANRATRFAVGDIRGAFTIEQPMSWETRLRGTKAHSRAAENPPQLESEAVAAARSGNALDVGRGGRLAGKAGGFRRPVRRAASSCPESEETPERLPGRSASKADAQSSCMRQGGELNSIGSTLGSSSAEATAGRLAPGTGRRRHRIPPSVMTASIGRSNGWGRMVGRCWKA